MLRELRIENLLLIERSELRFGPGLNAITGETGAGKTMLADSINLLLGGKPRSGIVRPGAEEAWVEGTFELPAGLAVGDDPDLEEILERLPAGEPEVVLARRVSASGRSSAFVAGRSASAADLRTLGSRLIAFYGQHEHRKLTLASAQASILDSFAGAEQLALRASYLAAHADVTRVEREIGELLAREGGRERDLDLLRFELAEIEEVAPEELEHDALLAERNRLRSVETLRDAATQTLAAIGEDGAGRGVGEADQALQSALGADPGLDALAERVRALSVETSDIGTEARAYLDGLESDPARLEQVEERMEAIERLLRKHGGSVESVLAHAARCQSEIERLNHAGEEGARLEVDLATTRSRREHLGEELSEARRRIAPDLEREVAAELGRLAMDGARLEVGLIPHPEGFGPTGRESVELRVATNPGMPVGLLREAASGGELSRVMLALSGLGPAAAAGAVVFDEIDAGIGGQIARRVGKRLRTLGEQRQVICITHLPQVASMAETHFRVEKLSGSKEATTRVERVEGDGVVAEIVRMLGADGDDEAADRHARELLAA